jgi:hypothetical protein
MAGINVLTSTIKGSVSWSAQNNLVGQDYGPITQSGSIQTTYTVGTNNANNASGGGDEFISYLININASSNTTVNCTALTNVMQQTSVSFVRIKGYTIRLLSATNDSVNGTAAVSITVGGAGSNQQNLELGGNTNTYTLNNGGMHMHFDPSSNGFAAVNTTLKNILITNLDSGLVACVQLTLIGGSS